MEVWQMFRRILVPLDGSPFAERVIPVAQSFVDAGEAEISFVRVVPLMGPGEREPGLVSHLDEHRIRTAQDYITRAASRLRSGQAPPADARLASDAVDGILARAAEVNADLILMTSHGESWPDINRIGGTASRLIREALVPLLVVGPLAGQTESSGTGNDASGSKR